MLITLGNTPHDLTVRLAPDADFVSALISDESWPDGTEIELRFFPRGADPNGTPTGAWPATITDERAEWNVDVALVRTVLAAHATHVRLIYTDGTGAELLWARGRTDAD